MYNIFVKFYLVAGVEKNILNQLSLICMTHVVIAIRL